jgi:hypothetical protein
VLIPTRPPMAYKRGGGLGESARWVRPCRRPPSWRLDRRVRPGWLGPGWLGPGWLGPGWLGPGWLGPGWLGPGWLGPGLTRSMCLPGVPGRAAFPAAPPMLRRGRRSDPLDRVVARAGIAELAPPVAAAARMCEPPSAPESCCAGSGAAPSPARGDPALLMGVEGSPDGVLLPTVEAFRSTVSAGVPNRSRPSDAVDRAGVVPASEPRATPGRCTSAVSRGGTGEVTGWLNC